MRTRYTYGDKQPLVAMSLGGNRFIRDEAMARGWRLVNLWHWLYSFPPDVLPRGAIVDLLPDDKRVTDILRNGGAVVRLGRLPHPDDHLVPAVLPDEFAAGVMAADHFFERGFQDVAYFGRDPWSDHKAMYDGFQQQAEALGMRCHLLRLKQGRFTGEAWERHKQEAFEAWLQRLPKPVGFLGSGDFITAQHCAWAVHAGLMVPEDVAVLSPGDTRDGACENALPRISVIDLNDKGRLHMACDLLERLMAGETKPKKPIMVAPAGVIQRESTDILATSDRVAADALRYIWEHIHQDVSVEQVANAVGLSPSQLQRRFGKAIGRTVVQELMRKRLEEAKRLLCSTELPVADLVPRLGLRSTGHFHKIFHAHVGMTPLQYRRNSSL